MFKNKKILLSLFTIFTLFVGIVFGLFLLFTHTKDIIVDDFSTKTIAEVMQWQKDNNIDDDLIIIAKEYSETYTKDTIISQSLIEGDILDTPIKIVISKGFDPNKKINMIDFNGLSKENIDKFFTNNHFSDVTYLYETSETISKDKFIKINNEEKSLARNSIIVITLSSGSVKDGVEIIMPDFSNSNKHSIDVWAKDYYIKVNYTYSFSDTVEVGKVISFTPQKDTTIKTNSSIQVTISKGKKIIVKDFIGKNKSELEKWIKEVNLTLNKYKEVYSSKEKDIILEQTPKAKTELAEEEEVTATISIGKVNIKNHINIPYSTFEKWLNDLNNKHHKSAKISVEKKEIESSITSGSIAKMTIGNVNYTSNTDTAVMVNPSSKIIVYVSKGIKVTITNKKGSSETEFKKYITDLGLIANNLNNPIYSDAVSGTIAYNDTGSKDKGSTINYKLSLGIYDPIVTDFNSKSVSDINNIIKTANDKNAGWSFIKKADVYSDTITKGLSLDCEKDSTAKQLKCNISKGVEPKPINVVDKSGISIDEFTSYLSHNGLVLGSKKEEYHESILIGCIISNDVGNKDVGSSINYVVSKGPAPKLTFQLTELLLNEKLNFEDTKAAVLNFLKNKVEDITLWNIVFEPVKNAEESNGRFVGIQNEGTFEIGETITFRISDKDN